jgi:outer membrane protein assembly factor BamB
MQDPGAPSTSGADPSGGVAWVVDTGPHAVLSAFDVRTGQELYRSTAADALGAAQRCVTPAVVGGRVYVGVHGGVVAYGLR